VLQRLHESPNVQQAIGAVFIAKASLILRSGMPRTEAVTVKPAYMSSDQQKFQSASQHNAGISIDVADTLYQGLKTVYLSAVQE
jgi:hypothetical protein